MAKGKEIVIQTQSYVTAGGRLTRAGELTGAQKGRLAAWLKLTWCQELYRGKAVFWVEGQPRPDLPSQEPQGRGQGKNDPPGKKPAERGKKS